MSEYPSDWTRTTFGNVLKQRKEVGYPGEELLAVTSSMGIVKRDSLERRDTSNEDKSKYLLVEKGDIAYNTMRMWQGVSGVSRFRGIVSPAYTICTPTEELDADFAGYLLKDPGVISIFRQRSQGLVSDTWNLKYEQFAQIPCALPPLPEQKKIAEILSGVDKVVHKKRILLEKVILLENRAFNEVVYEAAEKHPVATIESVTTKVIDGPHLTPSYQERGVPFATVKNVTSGKLDLTETKFITAEDHVEFCNRGKAEEGDILYSKDGSIGHTCVVPGGCDFSFFVSVALLKTNKEVVFPQFLNAVLQSELVKQQAELMSEGSGLKHMVLRSIKALTIPLPPMETQIELTARLQPVLNSIEAIGISIQRMSFLREAVASDLLSGRTRVTL